MTDSVDKKTHVVNGVRHPILTTAQHLKDLESFEIFEDDVVLMTSPKSGTTWMREIISLLMCGGDVQKVKEQFINQRFLFLDFPFKTEKASSSPRLLKTHLPPHQIPRQLHNRKAKIVFVSRNPKDTAVSFFHFHNSISVLPSYESWSDFLNDFCIGNLSRGDWFAMNSYWWRKRNEDNVLFVKYEDMQKDLSKIVKMVASFLKWPIKDEKLPVLLEHCDFETMRSNEKVDSKLAKNDTKKSIFMRKGKVGDWKNHFTVAQSEAFDKLYQEKMAGTGLEYEYEI